MNIFDFITQQELDDAPEDPALAFTQLVCSAQTRLARFTQAQDDQDQWSYQAIEDARHSFMNVVVGLAKAYKIEPFCSMDVPQIRKFDSDIHRQFTADLEHYMAQLLVSNSMRGKKDSVELSENLKQKIRSYIHGLKCAIDDSEFGDAKKEALHKRLSAFEAELDKRRLNLMEVAKVTIAVMAVPGSLWASYDVVSKLTQNVLQIVGEAKEVEDQNRQLPPMEPMPALLPPRQKETPKGRAELDDEIPF